jgi:hypothetical protein
MEVRGDLYLLPARGDTLAEWLANFGPQDMVVCVGLRRRVNQHVQSAGALQTTASRPALRYFVGKGTPSAMTASPQ